MQFKTTLGLFIAVVVMGVGIFFLRTKNPPPRPTVAPMKPMPGEEADRELIEKKPELVTEIAVSSEGQPDWKFVRDGDTSESGWRMVEPTASDVQKWQVEQIASTLTGLTYAVSYDKNATVTLESVGLSPPRAVVTLTDQDNTKMTVHVGRQEGANEAYVALNDSDTIYRVKRSLQYLLKKDYLEYIDRKLVDAKPDKIVRLRVKPAADDAESETYELVRSGEGWEFEQPVSAAAMADKIDKVCTTFGSLSTVAWVEDAVDDPALFGVGDEALTVTATIRRDPPKTPDSADADASSNGTDEDAAPTFEDVTIRFSSINPLGDKNKVYVRRGDERLIGTIMLTIADQFKPNLAEWRDNRLTTSDPLAARQVDLTVGDQSASFVRRGLGWNYADSGDPADRIEVETMLRVIKDTDAVNFVSGVSTDPAQFGFDAPRASVTMTYADNHTETYTVGGFTDEETKRLAYVRQDDSDTAAKVRVNDLDALVRSPVSYRDRTLIDVDKERFTKFEFRRKSKRVGEPAVEFTLTKDGKEWRMTDPIEGAVDTEAINKLVATLSNLRARELIDAGDDLTPFGLDDPDVVLSYSYLPPVIYKMKERENEDADDDVKPESAVIDVDSNSVNSNGAADDVKPPADDQPVKLNAEPYQPPSETLTIRATNQANNLYALREAFPEVVYVIPQPAYDQLSADYRGRDILEFDAAQVASFSLTVGEDTQTFEKGETAWSYAGEPDLPIDTMRVTNYLLRVNDLKAAGFVDFDAKDLTAYGLDAPTHKLTIAIKDAPSQTLLISERAGKGGGRYAAVEGQPIVFVLEPDALDRIKIEIADFEQPSRTNG